MGNRNQIRVHQSDEGSTSAFTLVELLVAIAIVGILAAVILPSLLGLARRARTAQGLTAVSTEIHLQQQHYVEHQRFSAELLSLHDNATYTIELLRVDATEAIACATHENPQMPTVWGRAVYLGSGRELAPELKVTTEGPRVAQEGDEC